MTTPEKIDYIDLLYTLDSILADFGNGDMLYPDSITDCEGDFISLTQEQAKEVFELNNGDFDACAEYESIESD